MNKMKVATVFSGIGAFEQALKVLNIEHEIVFACDNGDVLIDYDLHEEMNEIKKLDLTSERTRYIKNLYEMKSRRTNFVKKSYLHNYEISEDQFYQDIYLIDGTKYKDKIDIFVGGSPCQSFSTVGYQEGLESEKGELFYQYIRLLKEIQPKIFIYENVRGLYTHDKGKTWKIISQAFEELGYKTLEHKVLNSKEHGIPQNRSRLFVVGIREETDFTFPEAKELEHKLQDLLLDNCALGNFGYKNEKIEAIKSNGIYDEKYFLSEKLEAYVMSPGTKTFYQKPEIDLDIARPILATMGNRHRAGIDNYMTIDGKIRMLTEREAHRIQGFPDDYDIVVSRAQGYKQAGNSIPVPVLVEIIKQIMKVV